MKFKGLLFAPLFAALLLVTAAGLYSVPVTAQSQGTAQTKKPTQYHYVCPMHEDVTSKKRGICRKCKMKLERKPIKEEPNQGSTSQG
ncbi:MAG TPA: heavy metal-binding domain-containing protein [Pyrinomonadaceae bacterium]|nr:heavy metal-binding domain-containing protein [Pyrinomonadaceae bacterium]